eukprot:495223-Rhodomonas_salina.1
MVSSRRCASAEAEGGICGEGHLVRSIWPYNIGGTNFCTDTAYCTTLIGTDKGYSVALFGAEVGYGATLAQ